MEELVSVIVPVYNAESFIRETIKTVNEQTYKNWELIFVDDCSTDNSVSIIKQYLSQKIKLIELKKNSGAAVARNSGTKVANGRYIAFLDADDLWNKEKLRKQVEFMKEENCAFSYTGYQFTDSEGNPNGKKVFVPLKLNYKQALKNTTISTITVMFDLKKINKEKIEMPDVKSEDTACWWNILRQGYFAYGLNEVLSYYRRSEHTLSSNKFKSVKSVWNIYRKLERFNIFYSLYYLGWYILHAIKRRV